MTDHPIVPPATIGVLGGGQLGRYAVLAATVAGYRTMVLDPDPGSPAGAVEILPYPGRLNQVYTYQDLHSSPPDPDYLFYYTRDLVPERDVYLFQWSNIEISSLEDGEKFCLGAESIAGKLTLFILEITEIAGVKWAGVSRTDESDRAICGF